MTMTTAIADTTTTTMAAILASSSSDDRKSYAEVDSIRIESRYGRINRSENR
jgi:hypothetical protein